jgi:hypothetical protein
MHQQLRLIVDMTFIQEAARGRTLLRLWRRRGPRILAVSAESRRLAASIFGDAFRPAKQGLFERVAAFARGRFAKISVSAERGNGNSAFGPHKSEGFAEAGAAPRVECRVP